MKIDNSSNWEKTKLMFGNPSLRLGAQSRDNLNSLSYTFEENGTGTVLIYQDYCSLFYGKQEELQHPLRKVHITLSGVQGDQLIKIEISNEAVKLQRRYPQGGAELRDIQDKVEPVKKNFKPLFPSATYAPTMLYKKIWIQLNRIKNEVTVSVGDMYNLEEQSLLFYDFDNDYNDNLHLTWEDQENSYPMPNYNGGQNRFPVPARPINILSLVKQMEIDIQVESASNQASEYSQKLSDFLKIKFMKNIKNYGPVLMPNPSLLEEKVAPLADMPKEIQILYGYLLNCNITNLPDFKSKNSDLIQKQEYLNWRDMRFGIQDSLVRPYGYIDSQERRPVGIFNHLYKMKTDQLYETVDISKYKTTEDLLEYIYSKRQFYIRLELLPHEGLGPGSMAVLEVWPPYNCSIVHNHGEAYGIIKVLSGTIRVQNFNDLNFSLIDKDLSKREKPYQHMNYGEGAYTWLSQYSFCIHRLVNFHPEVTLCLQAYYHNEDTTQYFTCIDSETTVKGQTQKLKVSSLNEYYPQNDWHNYLYLVNTSQKPANDPDIKFIQSIIDRYQLCIYIVPDKKAKNGGPYQQLNTQFYQLALILKDTYEVASNLGSQKVPIWATSFQNIVFWLQNGQEENMQAMIQRFKGNNIEMIVIADTFSYKNKLEGVGKYLRHADKKFAIVDNLQHFSDPDMNKSAAANIFRKAESMGIQAELKIVLNKPSPNVDSITKVPKSDNCFAVSNYEKAICMIESALGPRTA